jgi:hypothetical protein
MAARPISCVRRHSKWRPISALPHPAHACGLGVRSVAANVSADVFTVSDLLLKDRYAYRSWPQSSTDLNTTDQSSKVHCSRRSGRLRGRRC